MGAYGQLALEAIWSGIAALGAQILFLGLRTRLGPGYAWFGAGLLAMAAVFFVPVWAPAGTLEALRPFAAYGLAAAGVFCVAGIVRLLGRFLAMHHANRETMDHLAAAFGSLRESAGFTALGASAAAISHEIRNYAATLRVPRHGGRPLCVLVDGGSLGEPPVAWRNAPFRKLDGEGCFAADPVKGRPARPLSEEAMLEWLAPG